MKNLNVNFPKSIAKFESAMKGRFAVKTVFYKKVFRGKGLEFDSYRAYSADDASLIDWKATAKAEKPLVRQYVEERDLKIFFIIDVGDNMVFGSGEKLKNEVAAEIAASLMHLVAVSGDSVGFALYSNKVIAMRPFSKGTKQFHIAARSLASPNTYGGKSDLEENLRFLAPYLSGASAVFIVSDFIKLGSGFAGTLKKFASRFETIGIMVRDPVDMQLPDLNKEIVVEDIYTGEQKLINPSIIRHEYEKHASEQKRKIEEIFKNANADLIEIYTDRDFVSQLVKFLKSRVKRGAYIMPKK